MLLSLKTTGSTTPVLPYVFSIVTKTQVSRRFIAGHSSLRFEKESEDAPLLRFVQTARRKKDNELMKKRQLRQKPDPFEGRT